MSDSVIRHLLVICAMNECAICYPYSGFIYFYYQKGHETNEVALMEQRGIKDGRLRYPGFRSATSRLLARITKVPNNTIVRLAPARQSSHWP